MKRLYRENMEGDLYDLRNMSSIVETLLEDALSCREKTAADGYLKLTLTDDQWDVLSFAAAHLKDMARDVLERYQGDYKKAQADAAS